MALKRDSLIEITDKSSKSEKVTCIWMKFLGIVLVAQKFRFQWQTFNGEKERCHRKVLPSNCPLVCPQTFFVFFFDRARRHPLALARAPSSTVSKKKILPLGQLVNIFSSLLYDYDCSTIPEGSCFVLMDHGEVLWPETILQRDSNPWPPLWRRSALPTVLWKPIHLEQTDLLLTRAHPPHPPPRSAPGDWCGFFYVPQEQVSERAVRRDLRFFVLIRED